MEHSTYCSAEITELAATLNSVMEACREALISNGIWLAQYPVPVDAGHMGLVTKLTHAESGQWQSSLMVMPLPKADPQGYGSAMTYSRRYALSALIGIVTEEDDDGVSAGTGADQRPRRKRQAQLKEDIPAKGTDPATGTDPQIHPVLAAMPKLDGINYSLTTTQDGKTCIVASGNTANKKQILSQAGFKYSEQRGIWWRYADAA